MNKTLFFSVTSLILLLSSSFLSGCIDPQETNNNLEHPFTPGLKQTLDNSIKIAEEYLVNITDEKGMFAYEFDPEENKTSIERYNILRHAGTIYSMVKIYNETNNEQMLSAIHRAIKYLTNQIKPYQGTDVVVYDDEMKIGGNALAIIALVEYSRVIGEKNYESTITALGDYLILSQKENGDFIHKRYYSTNQTSDFISEYYPGEAILAYCRLYKLTEDQSWLDAAEKATNYLIFTRDTDETVYTIIHDHWLLMGLNELYRYREQHAFYNHSKLITVAILAYQRDDFSRFSEETAWLGSYYSPPRSTPTATRTEGLLASYELFNDYNDNQSYLKRMLYSINLSIHFQLQMQYTKETIKEFSLPSLAIGGFKSSFDEATIRIDYVQHNICAIIDFYHLLQKDNRLLEKIEEFKDILNEKKLNCDILQQSLQLGSEFLLNNQREQGNFNYEYDFIDQIQSTDDNEVRQAGALWGVSLLYQQLQTKQLQEAYLNGFDFFQSRTLQHNNLYYIAYDDDQYYGKTGTVALVCLSLIDFLRSSPSLNNAQQQTLQSHLDNYLDFLVSLRMDNGLFHQYYYTSNGTGFDTASPYADGEALLAFCKAYNYQGRTDLENKIRETAFQTYQTYILDALEIDPDSDHTKGFFQWGIMSYYEILQTDWDNIENYSSVILSLADWMIDVHQTLQRTRNTAYAYEGIIHAYQIALEQEDEYHIKKFKHVIDIGLYKLTTWQVNGPIPNEYLQIHSTNDPEAVGGILNHKEEPYLRIDVTQHQMHAVILAMNYVYECNS